MLTCPILWSHGADFDIPRAQRSYYGLMVQAVSDVPRAHPSYYGCMVQAFSDVPHAHRSYYGRMMQALMFHMLTGHYMLIGPIIVVPVME